MEMMFLILLINREGLALPQSYPKDQCEKIASGYETANGDKVRGFCIPAPVIKYPDPALIIIDKSLPKNFCTADNKRCNIDITPAPFCIYNGDDSCVGK